MEVAWQRLPDKQKTSELARHWSRFGNLEQPKHKLIPVRNSYDDWRGIQQVHLRPDDLVREMGLAGNHLIRGHFDELFLWLDSLPKRFKLINRRW